MLNSSAVTVCGTILASYLVMIVLLALPMVAVVLSGGTAPFPTEESVFTDPERDVGHLAKIFLFTTTNVITMGWGPVAPGAWVQGVFVCVRARTHTHIHTHTHTYACVCEANTRH